MVFTRDPNCRLYTSGYGLQVPIIFHVVLIGSHYPRVLKRDRVSHFLPNLTHFSPFTPIFTRTLAVFMLRTSLLTPKVLLYLPLADCQRKISCCCCCCCCCLILACFLFISLKSTNCARCCSYTGAIWRG